ncbi:MAG: hypothetical protein PHV30_04090 [Candidatus Margulisbacteria bacterium]|nr:hypothetical protein [Candidatus Margulisiibacteriota bacterium]
MLHKIIAVTIEDCLNILLPKWLKAMKEASIIAGDLVLEKYYGTIKPLQDKDYSESVDELKNALKSAVTEADYEVQKVLLIRFIELGLHELMGVLSEEDNEQIAALEKKFLHRGELPAKRLTLVIDSIDGTGCLINTNSENHVLKRGNPANKDNFGISIGLAYGKKIIAGVVYMPARDILMSTSILGETRINNKIVRIDKNQRFSTSDPVKLSSTLKKSQLIPDFKALDKLLSNTKNTDSTVANMLAFLKGEMKIYISEGIDFTDFNMWGLMLRNAGGFMGNLEGNPITEEDLLLKTDKGWFLKGFFMLSPSREYQQKLIKVLLENNLLK